MNVNDLILWMNVHLPPIFDYETSSWFKGEFKVKCQGDFEGGFKRDFKGSLKGGTFKGNFKL